MEESQATLPKLLLMTKTSKGAYRHDSIPAAIDVLSELANGTIALDPDVAHSSIANATSKFELVPTEDDSLWEDDSYLPQFAAVAFVLTTDSNPPDSTSILSAKADDNLGRYLEAGGGLIGIHSATATLYGLPLYGRAMGAFFEYHEDLQPLDFTPVTRDHISTSKLPDTFSIDEEFYHFRSDPRALPSPAVVLLTSHTIPTPNAQTRPGDVPALDGPAPRPLAWYRSGRLLDEPSKEVVERSDVAMRASLLDSSVPGGKTYSGGAGRMFYTSLGHKEETWRDPVFQNHVLGGIMYVLQNSLRT